MSKKLFLVLVMLLCMSQSSKAGLFEADAMYDTAKAVNALTAKIGELVEAQKEQNELLKLIKNKLSDIAVLQAIDSNRVFIRYADSEENSGLKLKGTLNQFKPYPDTRIYYYHSEEMKKYSKELDGDK